MRKYLTSKKEKGATRAWTSSSEMHRLGRPQKDEVFISRKGTEGEILERASKKEQESVFPFKK